MIKVYQVNHKIWRFTDYYSFGNGWIYTEGANSRTLIRTTDNVLPDNWRTYEQALR